MNTPMTLDEVDKKYYANLQRISDQRAFNLATAWETIDKLRSENEQQAQVIAELVEALDKLKDAMDVGYPEYGYNDWKEMVEDMLAKVKGK